MTTPVPTPHFIMITALIISSVASECILLMEFVTHNAHFLGLLTYKQVEIKLHREVTQNGGKLGIPNYARILHNYSFVIPAFALILSFLRLEAIEIIINVGILFASLAFMGFASSIYNKLQTNLILYLLKQDIEAKQEMQDQQIVPNAALLTQFASILAFVITSAIGVQLVRFIIFMSQPS